MFDRVGYLTFGHTAAAVAAVSAAAASNCRLAQLPTAVAKPDF